MRSRPATFSPTLYLDRELWKLAQAAIDESGYTNTEAISRLLALLVATDPAKRAKLFAISPARALEIHAERAKPK